MSPKIGLLEQLVKNFEHLNVFARARVTERVRIRIWECVRVRVYYCVCNHTNVIEFDIQGPTPGVKKKDHIRAFGVEGSRAVKKKKYDDSRARILERR